MMIGAVQKSKLRRCWVKNCVKNNHTHRSLTFHNFPKPHGVLINISDSTGNQQKVDQLTAWKTILDLNKITTESKVCSIHFKKKDYFHQVERTDRPRLRRTAIPSRKIGKEGDYSSCKSFLNNSINSDLCNEKIADVNLVEDCVCNIIKSNEEKSVENEEKIKSTTSKDEISQDESKSMPEVDDAVQEETCIEVNNELCRDSSETQSAVQDVAEKQTCIEALRVSNDVVSMILNAAEKEASNEVMDCSDEFVPVVSDSNVKEKYTYCTASQVQNKYTSGIDITNLKLQSKECGVQCNEKSNFFDRITTKEKLTTGTGIDSFEVLDAIVDNVKMVTKNKYESAKCIMKTRDRVIMTFMKLKQNASYSFLSLILDTITPQHCRIIFLETVRVLGKILKEAIPWPSKEELSRNIPECFEGFEDTRVVVDCTEIFIQRPKNLCCQLLTYSHYKGTQTVKFMTAVTPGGNISHISKPYGGRACDTAIFEQSELITLLEPKDGVMVDKGFLIEKLCNKNQFRFIQPPFKKDKKQFSEAEAILSAKIAKARVHVERSNQRIKVFKILGSVLPAALVPYIEDIFTTICGTVNLSAPIIGNDKFIHDEFDE